MRWGCGCRWRLVIAEVRLRHFVRAEHLCDLDWLGKVVRCRLECAPPRFEQPVKERLDAAVRHVVLLLARTVVSFTVPVAVLIVLIVLLVGRVVVVKRRLDGTEGPWWQDEARLAQLSPQLA